MRAEITRLGGEVRFNQKVEVLEGLEAGDRIVTSAQFLIDSESAIDSDLQRIDVQKMEMGNDN